MIGSPLPFANLRRFLGRLPAHPDQTRVEYDERRKNDNLSRRHDQSYTLLFSLPLAVEHMIRANAGPPRKTSSI